VPLFGGLRGGRPRTDGLVPGSPEAIAADRERDRVRKQNKRDAAGKIAEPPPLPSATTAVVHAPQTPVAGEDAKPVGAPVSFVPWDHQTLKPLFDQLLPTIEDLNVQQLTSRAEKAKLPAEVVKEIGKDARWNSTSRKAVEIAAPQVAAKWLNKAGISAENQPEIVLGTAVVCIVTAQVKLLGRLDKLIALHAGQEKEEKAK